MYVCLRIHLEINHSFIKVINTPKIAQASTLVLIWSKRGLLNHRSVFEKCGHFFRRFSTLKTLSKSTTLLFIETPHKSSYPIPLRYVIEKLQVSLFAQQLGTKYQISDKRIENIISQY